MFHFLLAMRLGCPLSGYMFRHQLFSLKAASSNALAFHLSPAVKDGLSAPYTPAPTYLL